MFRARLVSSSGTGRHSASRETVVAGMRARRPAATNGTEDSAHALDAWACDSFQNGTIPFPISPWFVYSRSVAAEYFSSGLLSCRKRIAPPSV